jgi:NADH dehydrogenase
MTMSEADTRLKNGSRVAVVGGGPAGSFTAMYLLSFAQQLGVQLAVTVFQDRDFARKGKAGCKGCAGVLSLTFLRNLEDIGLRVPDGIIQHKIDDYTVHSPYSSIAIANPERDIQIASVYRGAGPARGPEPVQGFDAWLLRQAAARGAGVVSAAVTGIRLGGKPLVTTGDETAEYDLVVLATGVNGPPCRITGVGYVAPPTVTMTQSELYVGRDEVATRLGNAAHAFLLPHAGMVFGTLVPKGPYVTVSLLGGRGPSLTLPDFLKHDLVTGVLPGPAEPVCGCRPAAVVGPARNYYADRFVAVGDAAVSRLYKDGTGTGLASARQAAWTALHHGVAAGDFRRHYEPFCRSIRRHNAWGKALFAVNNIGKHSRTFLLAQPRLIGDEIRRAGGRQPFTRAAWGMFTGSYPYGQIAAMMLSPLSLARMLAAVVREGLHLPGRHRDTARRKIRVGVTRVLILGSGFGGAYVLRRLVPALNKNENVRTTMISDENFLLFSPLLHEVAMGRIESRHVAYPVRRLQWRDRFDFIQAAVRHIDLAGEKVETDVGTFGYDYLVLALGSVADLSGLKDPAQKTSVFTLKTLYDSRLIRNHVIRLFEKASIETGTERQKQLLTFIVSGAGYIGLQLVTELRDFINHSLKKYYKPVDTNNIRIILVEKEAGLMPEIDARLGAYALKQLRNKSIEVRFGSRLTRVWDDRVEINGKEIIPTATVIWLSGQVASPRIAELDVPKDDIGRVRVNANMEVEGFPSVYALGDCAHFEDPATGRPAPRRAHITVRQAKTVARNILAAIRGREKRPYRYTRPPDLVSLGVSRAMFRWRRLRLFGWPARLLWLGAYALLVTGTYNRVRIIIDWTSAIFFGRDTSYIKTKIGKSGQ